MGFVRMSGMVDPEQLDTVPEPVFAMLIDPAGQGSIGADVAADFFGFQPFVFQYFVALSEVLKITQSSRLRADDGGEQPIIGRRIQTPLLSVVVGVQFVLPSVTGAGGVACGDVP